MTQEQVEHLTLGIEALESGEFTQQHGRLRGPNGYCCLGVFCEVYRREHVDSSKWVNKFGSELFEVSSEDDLLDSGQSEVVMPIRVAEWFGLDQNPPLVIDGINEAASAHNDGRKNIDISDMWAVSRKTFPQIAQGFRNLLDARLNTHE